MDQETARSLLPFVNSDLYPTFTDYVNKRLDMLRTNLDNEMDVDRIRQTQGRIAELKLMLGLRDTANRDKKQ